ncbi:MAG: hypothetical protein HY290_02800 [Planctomycetia bacterium]|nr:hypothetical protein [Planctomycetia bacterium]
MGTIVEEKINHAIHDCLTRCYQSEVIVHEMASFLADLKKTGGWTTDELLTVEFAVLELLNSVVEIPDVADESPHKRRAGPAGPNRPR